MYAVHVWDLRKCVYQFPSAREPRHAPTDSLGRQHGAVGRLNSVVRELERLFTIYRKNTNEVRRSVVELELSRAAIWYKVK
jgi:hypothetical protein